MKGGGIMKIERMKSMSVRCILALMLLACALGGVSTSAFASGGSGSGSGGSGGGGVAVDTIKVDKCYSTSGGVYSQLLLKASSSDPTATLTAYLPSGALLGQVQNGGGGRYGGTALLAPGSPISITFKSSSGGVITVPTTPFQI